MFDCTTETLVPGRVLKMEISLDGDPLSSGQAVALWQESHGFRDYFTTLLASSPFDGFRWETPPMTVATADRPFEFIVVNAPSLCGRPVDQQTYSQYFTDGDEQDDGVVSFRSLGRDATLVVPCPRGAPGAYGHLAAFVRNGPPTQVDALWRMVGDRMAMQLSATPIWLNTHGGGVAWLHVRLDTRPKYYSWAPYKAAPSSSV